MEIEREIENCQVCLAKLKQYDPDPYYVSFFFNQYTNAIKNIINGIIEEANRDFGLFIHGKISYETFQQKAKYKNDLSAIKFAEWFFKKYEEEHANLYPSIMKKILNFKEISQKIPTIKLMIKPRKRYDGDFNQEVQINQKPNKRENLMMEIDKQIPKGIWTWDTTSNPHYGAFSSEKNLSFQKKAIYYSIRSKLKKQQQKKKSR